MTSTMTNSIVTCFNRSSRNLVGWPTYSNVKESACALSFAIMSHFCNEFSVVLEGEELVMYSLREGEGRWY